MSNRELVQSGQDFAKTCVRDFDVAAGVTLKGFRERTVELCECHYREQKENSMIGRTFFGSFSHTQRRIEIMDSAFGFLTARGPINPAIPSEDP